jgi:FkbM family methyltransferase
MKGIIKLLLAKFGYRFTKIDYYENLVNINSVPGLDFYYLFKNKISRDETICCFDIGANIGQTAKKLSAYFPNSIIYSFEPVKETYKLLQENVAEYSNIHTYNLAMGVSLGELEIFHRKNSEWNSLVKNLNEGAKSMGASSEIIKIDSIDNFVSENKILKIHFLKSDTEGFEKEVLQGAKYCLENQLIDMIYIEVGFSKKDRQHTHFTDIMEQLENYNYGCSGLFEKCHNNDNTIHYANALFCKKNQN